MRWKILFMFLCLDAKCKTVIIIFHKQEAGVKKSKSIITFDDIRFGVMREDLKSMT